MGEEDDRRKRRIVTPVGDVQIWENLWNEGEENEHWAHVQEFNRRFTEDDPHGEILAHFLKNFAIAQTMCEEGYVVHSALDDVNILWVKYTHD